jgi:hypothetical protein
MNILFIVDLFGLNPIWQLSSLLSIVATSLLFNRIAKILYEIFNRVIGL